MTIPRPLLVLIIGASLISSAACTSQSRKASDAAISQPQANQVPSTQPSPSETTTEAPSIMTRYATIQPAGDPNCIFATKTASRITGNAVRPGTGITSDGMQWCLYQAVADNGLSLNVSVMNAPGGADPCSADWAGLGWQLTPTPTGCMRMTTSPPDTSAAELIATDTDNGQMATLTLQSNNYGSATPASSVMARFADAGRAADLYLDHN